MNDPVLIRRAVRRALALRPRDGLTEEVIIEAVKMQGYQSIKVPEFREAIEWNHARDLIEFEHSEDLDADLWKLTRNGKIKEGIA